MIDNKMILYASTIDGTGGGEFLHGDRISDLLRRNDLAWVHLNADHPDTRAWLESELSYLDQIILDALLAEETRPRIVEFDRGALMILRGVNLNENAEPEDMVSVRLWVDEHRIISLRKRKLRAIEDIQNHLRDGTGPKNSGDFVVMLTARLFERMEPVLRELDERLDDIEQKVMEDPDFSERQAIIEIRKEAIIYRRYIAPQRDVIAHLRSGDQPWLDVMQKRCLQEAMDRVTRYIEDLDAIRERAQIVKDELANALSDKMNKNLYILSVIAAIFLPLGFLTGLLGINVGGIPGSENPQAFWGFCVLLCLVVVGEVTLFRKMKWF
jgi:zinc transporter